MAAGRVYTATFDGTAVTVGADIFEIIPASNRPIAVVGLFLGQSSDVGDAAEEILRYQIIRGYTTSGSGGTTAAAGPALDEFEAAAGFTFEACNTTGATGGTPVILHSGTFNVRVGEPLWFPPGMQPRCSAAQNRLVVRLTAAPADSLTMTGTIYIEEV